MALKLVEYIQDLNPIDYTYEGYYMDAPCIIKMGVNEGSPYFEEEELNLSKTEFVELYKKLYQLD